jgi:hypothetical protein
MSPRPWLHPPIVMICVVLAVTLACIMATRLIVPLSARQHPTARQPEFVDPWQVVAQKAKAAYGSDDPAAVGEFVDEIFRQSLFHGMAASVKARIARAEVAFRRSAHIGLRQKDLIAAVDQAVTLLGLPDYVRVTPEQLRVFRKKLRIDVRHFAREDPPTAQSRPDMSPAELAMILCDLGTQKLANPDYQVDPDEWAKATEARINALKEALKRRQPIDHTAVTATVKVKPTAYKLRLPDDLGFEEGPSVLAIHQFLDRIGLER